MKSVQSNYKEMIDAKINQAEMFVKDIMNFSTPMLEKAQLQHSLIQEFLDNQSTSDKLNIKLLISDDKNAKPMEEVCENLIQYIKGLKESTFNRLVQNLASFNLRYNNEIFEMMEHGFVEPVSQAELDEKKSANDKKGKKKIGRNKSKGAGKKDKAKGVTLKSKKKKKKRNSTFVHKSKEVRMSKNLRRRSKFEARSLRVLTPQASPRNIPLVRKRSSSINIHPAVGIKPKKRPSNHSVNQVIPKKHFFRTSYSSKDNVKINHLNLNNSHSNKKSPAFAKYFLKTSEESDSMIENRSITRKKLEFDTGPGLKALAVNTSWESLDDIENYQDAFRKGASGDVKVFEVALDSPGRGVTFGRKGSTGSGRKDHYDLLQVKKGSLEGVPRLGNLDMVGNKRRLRSKKKLKFKKRVGSKSKSKSKSKTRKCATSRSNKTKKDPWSSTTLKGPYTATSNLTKGPRRSSLVANSIFRTKKKTRKSYKKKLGDSCNLNNCLTNGDKGLGKVEGILKSRAKLKTLRLAKNNLSDLGALSLISMVIDHGKNLETIDLSHNLITEKFLITLNKMDTSYMKLRRIELRDCGIFTSCKTIESLVSELQTKGIEVAY